MGIRDGYPIRFTPKGLSDAYDSTDTFPGACTSIANLIFDQSNPEILISRPGVTALTSFAGFNSPGVVSVFVVIGTVIYGLLSTGKNPGKDEPFAFDTTTSTFTAVTGVTAANSPTTQATSGAWTPPTMAMIGTQLIVTHPGFSTGANKFGYFDLSNPAIPVWAAGTTATNGLPSVPTAVANFNNRAYFSCGNVLWYSDVLVPRTITNASQSLTLGDSSAITVLQGLAIQQSSAGVASALIVFKGTQVWQITGDATGSTLAQNYISLYIGCSAPRTVSTAPDGIYFTGIGGPYLVDNTGFLRPVVYGGENNEPDLQVPFQNVTTPTRAAAAYAGSIYRVCLPTIVQSVVGTNDYWFDEHRRRWSGPHSFAYDCAAQLSNYFVLSSVANPGILFKSQVVPDSTSVYTDNGTSITSTLIPASLPKLGRMTEKQAVESTVELSSSASSVSYSFTAYDETNRQLDSTAVTVTISGGLYGSFVWGDGTLYTSSNNVPKTYSIPWNLPLVFKKLSVQLTATSSGALAIGTQFTRYQDCGYRNRL